MKNKTLKLTLIAGLVFSSLFSPAVMAACHGSELTACPARMMQNCRMRMLC